MRVSCVLLLLVVVVVMVVHNQVWCAIHYNHVQHATQMAILLVHTAGILDTNPTSLHPTHPPHRDTLSAAMCCLLAPVQ